MKVLFSLFIMLAVSPVLIVAQRNPRAKLTDPPVRSIEQQDALDLLRTLAQNLKSEPDKLSAGRLQARIAGELWVHDELFARNVFRWAFDAVSQPMPDGLSETRRSDYVVRQASAVNEVLRRLGAHDSKRAEAWLKTFEDERLSKNPSEKIDTPRLELLMQIALQIAPTDPEQAVRLGITSLSGTAIPSGFGQLLFAVANQDRSLSDNLFRAAIPTLRRNNYVNDPALIAMCNYLFSSSGELHAKMNLPEAKLLVHYFVDAAWRQGSGEGTPLPPSSASFYGLLETRAAALVERYAPERLPELRGQMSRMASRLTPEQIQHTSLLKSAQQQQSTIAGRNSYGIDEQIERAEKEKDLQVRDALFNSIAHVLMRQDTERALAVTARIDDASLRMTTEDDINLVKIQQYFHSRSYEEARKTTSKLNNSVFRAKVLVQLASKIWSDNKDAVQSGELLTEATTAAVKSDDSADKVLALLHTAEQFARFDAVRAFDTLGTAITTLNRMKTEKEAPHSVLTKPALLRFKSYTVLNGAEMTTTNDATLESIDFSQIRPLVIHDYMQSRLTANKIESPLQRANYLTTVASTVLHPENRRPLTTSKN
jgi:hypothetical protein